MGTTNGPRRTREENRKKDSVGRTKKIGIAVLIAVLIVVIGIVAYIQIHKQKVNALLAGEGILQGVTIDGVDVAGKSEEEAIAMLKGDYDKKMDGKTLTLSFHEEEWKYDFVDLSAGYDVAGAVKEAYDLGRKGTEEERFHTGSELLRSGIDVRVKYGWNKEVLKEKLDEVQSQFNRDAKDSELKRAGGGFQIKL